MEPASGGADCQRTMAAANSRRSPVRSAIGVAMTAEQAALLKQLAHDAYEPDAFKPRLTQAEVQRRIAMLTAKLKLLDEPPHTL